MLGPLEVWDGERRLVLGGFRQRLVLAVLLLHANRTLSTDWLIDAVWGEEPPRTARKTLQVYISRLRSLLGSAVIGATDSGYVLHVSPHDVVDSLRFEELAKKGQRLLESDPAAAAGTLRRSLALWRGMPWGELGDELAIQPDAQRLRELRLTVLEARITADLDCGRAASVVGELEGLVDEHALRERFRAQLMLALYRTGRQSEALRLFQDTRRVLGDVLGIEPSTELRYLEELILFQDPSIDGPSTVAGIEDWALARNPYKGLRAFEAVDVDDFYGRLDLVDELVTRIEREPFVAVVGASGSGKSSVVRAGLVPRLRSATLAGSRRWLVATMVPGHDPFGEFQTALLAATSDSRIKPIGDRQGDNLDVLRIAQSALPDERTALLLVIDQFEELLHRTDEEEVSGRFIRNLVEAIEDPLSQITVLVTLRADFFDRMLERLPLGPLIADGLVSVLPLTAAALEAAAARPAERVGAYVEPELIAELIADMTDQPGALPLFQYVLTELFEQRTGSILTRSVYRRLGGLRGALSRRAEEIYQALDGQDQAVTRQLLLRLVTVGDDVEDTRRRVEQSELEELDLDGGTVKVVLDAFGRARLLSFDRSPASGAPTVEVSHEALLREWPRLQKWIDAVREDLRLHRALVAEVAEWESSGRDPDYLLTGSRLDLYDAWSAGRTIELTETERAFLDAGVERREDEHAAEESRRDEKLAVERRAVRRLRWLVVVVSVAALVAAGLTLIAVDRSRDAAASERETRARELANAATAAIDADPEMATLLALEAIDVTRSTEGSVIREAEEALHAAVTANRLVATARGLGDVEFHPDGWLFVGGRPARLLDLASGEDRLALPSPEDGKPMTAVAVNGDGTRLATGTGNGDLVVWDGRNGSMIRRFSGPGGPAHGDTIGVLAFSPDDRLLASLAPRGGGVRVWNVESGEMVASFNDPDWWSDCCPGVELDFSPDGTHLAVTTFEGEVHVFDLASSTRAMTLTGHEGAATGVEYLPSGATIITGSFDGTFRFWDAEIGIELASIDAGVGQLTALDVSADGGWLLTGGDSGTVRLWELQPGGARELATLAGHRSLVLDVAFDAAGELGAGVGMDGGVLVWDVTASGRGEVAAWPADGPVAFSADGSRLAAPDSNGRGVIVRRTSDWRPDFVLEDVAPLKGEEHAAPGEEYGVVGGIAFSPGGDRIATTSSGYQDVPGTVTLWDASTGAPLRTLLAHLFLTGPVAFSGDGATVAAATCNWVGSPASAWDVASGEVILAVETARCGQAVDLSPNGELLAVSTELEDQPNVQVWNVATGELVSELTHEPLWIGAVQFSPDGERLLTAGNDGTARIWDVATGDLIRALAGHNGPVEGAVWAADGARIVTASLDGTIRQWDAATGGTLLVLSGFEGLAHVALSPDGGRLATSADGVVRIWTLELDELIGIAESRLTRSLTSGECATYHFEECP